MNSTLENTKVVDFLLYKADNNLDKVDNLNDLPNEKAVYAISGRINGKPANCRYVGECDNLQSAIRLHFSDAETDHCLRQFMQSIKIKTLDYVLLPGSTQAERDQIKTEWKVTYKPECNEQLNKVF